MTWWAVGLFHCVQSFHHTVVIIYNWWTSSSLSLLLKWPEPSNPNLQFQEIQVECHPPRLFGKLWMSPDGLSLCKWAPAPLIDSFIDLNLRWIWRVSNHFKNQKQKSTGRNDRINRYQKRFHSIAYSNDYYCCCCCCCCCCYYYYYCCWLSVETCHFQLTCHFLVSQRPPKTQPTSKIRISCLLPSLWSVIDVHNSHGHLW